MPRGGVPDKGSYPPPPEPVKRAKGEGGPRRAQPPSRLRGAGGLNRLMGGCPIGWTAPEPVANRFQPVEGAVVNRPLPVEGAVEGQPTTTSHTC
jgi:hypothetical protein